MQTFVPKDERIFSWDPENMEAYWRQCELYDYKAQQDILEADVLSSRAYQNRLASKLTRF